MKSQLSRREFLRLVQAAGATAFLQACARAGLVEEDLTVPQPTQPPATITQPGLPTPTPIQVTPIVPSAQAPAATLQPNPTGLPANTPGMSQVVLVKTGQRAPGVRHAIELWETHSGGALARQVNGARTLLKPNFNSADPTPGSTHPEVLRTLASALQEMGARQLTVGDRSGMGDTRQVMQRLGVFEMAKELGFETLAFEDLPLEEWSAIQPPGSHWREGFLIPKICLESGAVVQTCCLKTHRYGGHFTLALKNSVGLAAKHHPSTRYNYMNELHGSSDQRRMIAEINAAYQPALVVVDGVEAFISGGPDRGEKVAPEVILAGIDRVAIDVVGVALLKKYGANLPGAIYSHDQIARAVEIGLGAPGIEQIEFVTGDEESFSYAQELANWMRLNN